MIRRCLFGLILSISVSLDVHASEQLSPVQGFIEIPFTTTASWDDVIDLPVYTDSKINTAPKKVITDFSALKFTYMGFEGERSANVYSVQPGWYEVRTTDNQQFWIKQNATTGYTSYVSHLHYASIAGHADDLVLLSGPKDDAQPVEQPPMLLQVGRYAILEAKIVLGVLWLQVKHSWTETQHLAENISKDNIQFNYQGWVRAHDADGEPAYEFWVSC